MTSNVLELLFRTAIGFLNAQEFSRFLREDHNVITILIEIREFMLDLWVPNRIYQIIQNRRLDYPKLWNYKVIHGEYPPLTKFQYLMTKLFKIPNPSRIDFEGCSTHSMEQYCDIISNTKRNTNVNVNQKSNKPTSSKKNKRMTVFSVRDTPDINRSKMLFLVKKLNRKHQYM